MYPIEKDLVMRMGGVEGSGSMSRASSNPSETNTSAMTCFNLVCSATW